MAKGILGEAGLHFDELNKLRVLDPEVSQQTVELKEECKAFVDKIAEFKKNVGSFIELVDQQAKTAENEKIKMQVKRQEKILAEHGQTTQKTHNILVILAVKAFDNTEFRAIGARNLLTSITKQREAQQQQLQALIAEKTTQLERYRVEYETLCKTEVDQNEFIDQFIFQK